MCSAPVWIYEVFDVFSVPNEDYVLPVAGITLKGFLKTPCRMSRKSNFEFLIVIEDIARLCVFHLFWNSETLEVFPVPNNIGRSPSRIVGRTRAGPNDCWLQLPRAGFFNFKLYYEKFLYTFIKASFGHLESVKRNINSNNRRTSTHLDLCNFVAFA